MRIGLYKVCLYVVITRRVSWKNIIDIVFVREYNKLNRIEYTYLNY